MLSIRRMSVQKLRQKNNNCELIFVRIQLENQKDIRWNMAPASQTPPPHTHTYTATDQQTGESAVPYCPLGHRRIPGNGMCNKKAGKAWMGSIEVKGPK